MAKHIIKISVILLWAGLMGWWWRESRAWPVPEKIEAAFLPDFSDYYSLSFGDQKIGWANKSLRRLEDGGYQGLQSLTVKVALDDQTLEITFSATANFDRLLNLTDFRYILQAGPLVVAESGRVTVPEEQCLGGKPCEPVRNPAEADLTVEVNLGQYGPDFQRLIEENRELLGAYADLLDFSRPARLAAPVGPGLLQFIPPYLSYLGLSRGRNYVLDVLDPARRTMTPATVRVEDELREYDPETGREMAVYRVRLNSGGGGGLLWIDRYGRTVREESLGFKLERVVSLASKYEEPSLAARGATPLKPPPGLQNLLKGREMSGLLEKIRTAAQGRRPAEATGPAPEALPAEIRSNQAEGGESL